MSWTRIDDEAWHHDKFCALQAAGVDGMAAIGLWAMAISFTGQKKSPILTITEATMLCGGDQDLASRCLDLLQSACLADCRSASNVLGKQTPKQVVIHDWECYRSKNEARVLAGRKGGKKSAEIRQAKSKQTPKQTVKQTVKQSPSPPPSPVPEPVPDPVPDPNYSVGLKTAVLSVFERYRKHHPTAMKKPRPAMKEWKLIRNRIDEGFSAAELGKAIDGMHKTPHNLGENDRGQKYLSLELCMRSNSHVQRFLENDDNPPKSTKEPKRASDNYVN